MPDPLVTTAAIEAVKDALRAKIITAAKEVESGDANATAVSALDPIQQLHHADFKQDIRLKKIYSGIILGAVLAQLVVSNAVFVAYAWAGKDWNIPPAVIGSWFSATIVEMIGLAWVVTKYLFPNRDGVVTEH